MLDDQRPVEPVAGEGGPERPILRSISSLGVTVA